ncbi:MAG: hypothetical protein IT285_11625 [Bdellovibrionales bacterium]|nr:hypothetical protein [Bdellovibrionales bacterium]
MSRNLGFVLLGTALCAALSGAAFAGECPAGVFDLHAQTWSAARREVLGPEDGLILSEALKKLPEEIREADRALLARRVPGEGGGATVFRRRIESWFNVRMDQSRIELEWEPNSMVLTLRLREHIWGDAPPMRLDFARIFGATPFNPEAAQSALSDAWVESLNGVVARRAGWSTGLPRNPDFMAFLLSRPNLSAACRSEFERMPGAQPVSDADRAERDSPAGSSSGGPGATGKNASPSL